MCHGPVLLANNISLRNPIHDVWWPYPINPMYVDHCTYIPTLILVAYDASTLALLPWYFHDIPSGWCYTTIFGDHRTFCILGYLRTMYAGVGRLVSSIFSSTHGLCSVLSLVYPFFSAQRLPFRACVPTQVGQQSSMQSLRQRYGQGGAVSVGWVDVVVRWLELGCWVQFEKNLPSVSHEFPRFSNC